MAGVYNDFGCKCALQFGLKPRLLKYATTLDRINSRQNCCTEIFKKSAVPDKPSPQRPKNNKNTDTEEKIELFEEAGVESLDIERSRALIYSSRAVVYPVLDRGLRSSQHGGGTSKRTSSSRIKSTDHTTWKR
jgi:hypothetical protein